MKVKLVRLEPLIGRCSNGNDLPIPVFNKETSIKKLCVYNRLFKTVTILDTKTVHKVILKNEKVDTRIVDKLELGEYVAREFINMENGTVGKSEKINAFYGLSLMLNSKGKTLIR